MPAHRMLPAERRARLIKELTEHGAIHIAGLSRQLGVSPMTLHRDLDELARQGYVRKVRGGALALPGLRSHRAADLPAPDPPWPEGRCGACAKPVGGRHTFVVHQEGGGTRAACCAHCGLLLLGDEVATAVAADFLFGHGINARTAFYVVKCDLVVCCAPAVLAFGRREDAERFRQGFGGEVMGLERALAWLRAEMALTPAPLAGPVEVPPPGAARGG